MLFGHTAASSTYGTRLTFNLLILLCYTEGHVTNPSTTTYVFTHILLPRLLPLCTRRLRFLPFEQSVRHLFDPRYRLSLSDELNYMAKGNGIRRWWICTRCRRRRRNQAIKRRRLCHFLVRNRSRSPVLA